MNTITVPAGQDKVIRLGDGDTLENTLIDQTANGASARVVVVTGNASTTTIKNVGFKGKPASHFGHFQITAQAHDTNGKIVIENVYLADPPRNPSNYDTGGMYVHNRHKGDILIKNCNIQNWGNNAIYAADPGMQGGSSAYGRGTVRVENVFSKSNNISNCRLGSAGSYVKDSVLWADGNAPHAGSAYNERGFWGEFMTTKVLNCDIQATKGSAAIVAIAPHGYQYGEPSVEVDNSRVAGNYVGKHIKEHNVTKNPDTSMPSGVPTSASHAASGQTGPSGLQPGDDLGKWIKNNVNDGGTYKVPSGTYDFTTAVVKKSNFTLTAPEGATLNASGVEVLEILGDGWTLEGFEFKSEAQPHRTRRKGEELDGEELRLGRAPGGQQGVSVLPRVYRRDVQSRARLHGRGEGLEPRRVGRLREHRGPVVRPVLLRVWRRLRHALGRLGSEEVHRDGELLQVVLLQQQHLRHSDRERRWGVQGPQVRRRGRHQPRAAEIRVGEAPEGDMGVVQQGRSARH